MSSSRVRAGTGVCVCVRDITEESHRNRFGVHFCEYEFSSLKVSIQVQQCTGKKWKRAEVSVNNNSFKVQCMTKHDINKEFNLEAIEVS